MYDKDSLIWKYHKAMNPVRLFQGSKEMEVKLEHIIGMAKICKKIAVSKGLGVNFELLDLCALHHDDGRVRQYQLLGNFNDRVATHHELGAMMVNQWCMQNEVEADYSIELLRNIMMYHGRLNLAGENVIGPTKLYLEIISDADDIENGCIGAIGYLLDECKADAKGYNKTHPERYGKIKPELWGYFERGEWFDKMKYCESYAEYVLFAATLAMKSIVKYGDIAKEVMLQPCYGYESALAGYEEIFRRTMPYGRDADRAICILRNACGR